MSTLKPVDQPATWVRAATYTGGFVVLLWLLEVVDTATGDGLEGYGVRPRDREGLLGVMFAPVLHGDWDHLISNTVPVIVLGFLVLVTGISRGVLATAIIWAVGGVGVWLLAPGNTIHLGASVLVFGWLVYLMVRGFFTRRAGEIVLGLTLFLLYGTLLLGVLPGQPGVSWQGHLFGALGGLLAAIVLSERRERSPAW